MQKYDSLNTTKTGENNVIFFKFACFNRKNNYLVKSINNIVFQKFINLIVLHFYSFVYFGDLMQNFMLCPCPLKAWLDKESINNLLSM